MTSFFVDDFSPVTKIPAIPHQNCLHTDVRELRKVREITNINYITHITTLYGHKVFYVCSADSRAALTPHSMCYISLGVAVPLHVNCVKLTITRFH